MGIRTVAQALLGSCLAFTASPAPAAESSAIGSAQLPAGDELAAAAKGACDAGAMPGRPGGGQLKRYEVTFLASHTEFDPKTCKPHGAGSWSLLDKEPCDGGKGCGTVSFGVLHNRTLASGQCAGHTYDFGAICYTWTLHSNVKVHDNVKALYVPPEISPVTETFPIRVPIVQPDGEKTRFANWHPEGYGVWGATIASKKDPGFDWTTGIVQESDPGGSKPSDDTCWCSASMYQAFYRITGGTWELQSSGAWKGDGVGPGKDLINYYRLKRRAPCGTKLPQQMQYQAEAVSSDSVNYGPVNTLSTFFNYKQLTSSRAGKSMTEAYGPVATKSRLACSAIHFPDPSKPLGKPGDRIVIDDPRPVAAAMAEIERVSGVVVTYEDAPIADRARMAAMVSAATADDVLLAPKRATLETDLPLGKSVSDVVAAAAMAANAYIAKGRGAARYAVVQDALIHVVAREAADASGKLVASRPALDTRISLRPQSRSGFEMLQTICDAVSAAYGRPVHVGTVYAPALNAKVTFGAENQTARDVLTHLVVEAGGRLSWRLFYDPGVQEYALNVTTID